MSCETKNETAVENCNFANLNNFRYSLFCSYLIKHRRHRRLIRRNLSWDDVTKLRDIMQKKAYEKAELKGKSFSSWTGHLYIRQLEVRSGNN